MDKKIEIRCRNSHCNRLFMNYFVTGNNVDLNLGGFELKCDKCKKSASIEKIYRTNVN